MRNTSIVLCLIGALVASGCSTQEPTGPVFESTDGLITTDGKYTAPDGNSYVSIRLSEEDDRRVFDFGTHEHGHATLDETRAPANAWLCQWDSQSRLWIYKGYDRRERVVIYHANPQWLFKGTRQKVGKGSPLIQQSPAELKAALPQTLKSKLGL